MLGIELNKFIGLDNETEAVKMGSALLENSNFEKQKIGLIISNYDKPFYDKNDVPSHGLDIQLMTPAYFSLLFWLLGILGMNIVRWADILGMNIYSKVG